MLPEKGSESVCVVNVDVTYLWLLALSVDNSIPGKPCCKKKRGSILCVLLGMLMQAVYLCIYVLLALSFSIKFQASHAETKESASRGLHLLCRNEGDMICLSFV